MATRAERERRPEAGPYDRSDWQRLLERAARHEPGLSRRRFLQMLGASAALAGAGGACFEAPDERVLPYVDRPRDVTPGLATRYATTLENAGYGTGVVIDSREGRPVKVEGNPRHPASLGAAGVHEQASLLDLYDPARARTVLRAGAPSSWGAFLEAFRPEAGRRSSGAGLHVLLEPTASPLVAREVERLRERLPEARFHFHAPLHGRSPLEGARLVFGRPLDVLPDLAEARVVAALDADPLGSGPFHLRHARAFADGRRLRGRRDPMNRLYAAGPSPSPTGDAADHRLRLAAGRVPALALALLREIEVADGKLSGGSEGLAEDTLPEPAAAFARACAGDLWAHRGAALVVAGDQQPPLVHALTGALNARLAAAGRSVHYLDPLRLDAAHEGETLAALVDAMRAGAVETLVVAGPNPVYDAPADLAFAAALERVPRTVCLASHPHETALRCGWLVPALHALEAWGDARACDGTASIVQPLVRPLWEGRTLVELLAVFAGEERTARKAVEETWTARLGGREGFERALALGVVEGTEAPRRAPAPDPQRLARALRDAPPHRTESDASVELLFRPDARVGDGRFANNPWLQELPDPVTKLTWDNAAWLAPSQAERLGVESGDWLSLRADGRRVEIPALVVPGQADDSVTVSLGYGRGALPVAGGVGFDVYPLRTSRALWRVADFAIEPLPARARHPLARTQTHAVLGEREPVRELSLERLRHLDAESFAGPVQASLYGPPDSPTRQWGMAIDLTLCTGCSACVVACQAENNLPVVGKQGVLTGREMHWLRIDRYHREETDGSSALLQPMLCQHCEMAPCEYVCPVNATVHSPDGLNEMIYNRCIGTRFCSNNCPYKVRRFNWFDYNAHVPEPRRMQWNPEVSVRARGVMEKCTYCVQRIRGAEQRATAEGRPLEEARVRTACQQACPTRAIDFGAVSDPASEVSATQRAPHAYGVLAELGTRPRTRYLARVRNPNRALAEER